MPYVPTTITAISTDWGTYPRIVRITTLSDLADITTNGYLQLPAVIADIQNIQNGTFEWTPEDYCLISYAGGEGFFTVDYTVNYTFTAAATVPGTLSDTLAAGHIFVGNGANVATGVAMTGIVAVDDAGATSIPLAAGHILVGSGAGEAAAVAMSGDATLSDLGVITVSAAAITSAKIAPNVMQFLEGTITLAGFLANYGTPVLCIPAVAGKIIVIDSWAFEWVYGSAALVGGGAISLQYGNTTHGGGIQASNAIAAADLTGLAATSTEYSAGGLLAISANTDIVDTDIYLSNPTAAFTVGTGGTANIFIWYREITP